MSISLSSRIERIQPSPTLAITALAAQLRAQGKDVIGLGAGEPDFDTPEHIKQAAIDAIHSGKTGYTAVGGVAELKQAVVDKFERENSLSYSTDEVLVSVGGKQTLYNLCIALLQEGDEVIIPAPYWVSYPDMVKLADATPVIIEASQSQQFKITPAQLRGAITEKTKLVFLNSPSNPTGVGYSRDELAALADVLLEHPNIFVATDDMYEHILFQGEFTNIVNAKPEIKSQTIVFNGVSKAYAMTGWRIGYCAGPIALIKAMTKAQSQSTSNPCSIAQYAAIAALNGGTGCVQPMLVEFRKRHDYLVEGLNAIDGIECLPSDGTFYSFPNVVGLIARLDGVNDDSELAAYLLEKIGVAVVPGVAFGAPGHVRLSYATSMDNLQQAITRMATL